jgi:hypothetical protein
MQVIFPFIQHRMPSMIFRPRYLFASAILLSCLAIFLLPAIVAPPCTVQIRQSNSHLIPGKINAIDLVVDPGRHKEELDIYIAILTPDYRLLYYPDLRENKQTAWQGQLLKPHHQTLSISIEPSYQPGVYAICVAVMKKDTQFLVAPVSNLFFEIGNECFQPWSDELLP